MSLSDALEVIHEYRIADACRIDVHETLDIIDLLIKIGRVEFVEKQFHTASMETHGKVVEIITNTVSDQAAIDDCTAVDELNLSRVEDYLNAAQNDIKRCQALIGEVRTKRQERISALKTNTTVDTVSSTTDEYY